jgi:riboflavin synthase
MFTGLVAGRGFIHDVRPEGGMSQPTALSPGTQASPIDPSSTLRLIIRVPDDFEIDGQLGESVAINGCCLTVVDIDGRFWSFQAGSETLSKTNLRRLGPGDVVNLERALPVNGRLGGHFVQGHIDGLGQVDRVDVDGEWVTMWFRGPRELVDQLVPKGSVAIDGVSLTVVQITGDRFSVALIPHTLQQTTLGVRKPGNDVNLETDILGKYVQRLLER